MIHYLDKKNGIIFKYELSDLGGGNDYTYYFTANDVNGTAAVGIAASEAYGPFVLSPASIPFLETFESGNLAEYWSSQSTTGGSVLITTSYYPYDGNYHLIMHNPGGYSLNEMILTVNFVY